MLLYKIKDYLSQVKIANLLSIGQQVNVAPDIVKTMLQHWVNKGYVRQVLATTQCGQACKQCRGAESDVYEWVAADNRPSHGRRLAVSVLTYCNQ
jgi:hypothetical protein